MLLLLLLLQLSASFLLPPCYPLPLPDSAAKSLCAFGGIVSGALFYFPGRSLSAPASTPTCVLAEAR